MKILYLDCFSGASGDMLVGALIDLGLDLKVLESEMGKLRLTDHFHLHAERQTRQAVSGIKFSVHDHDHHDVDAPQPHSHGHDHSHPHEHSHSHEPAAPAHHHHTHGRTYAQIQALIKGSSLGVGVQHRALQTFHRIALAEAKIHGVPVETVGFHEVGALDSIVDIVAFCVGIETLGIDRVLASPLVDGNGWVNCAHGRFRVPTPATLEILAGIPLTQTEDPHELLTPTGAALLAEFAVSFAPMQNLKTLKVGYGLGTRSLASRPNLVRAILAESVSSDNQSDTVIVLETNLDDLSGEMIADAQIRLFAAGALDVFTIPVQMKKNRPGVLLTVLAGPEKAILLSEILLTHTSAFGIRQTTALRRKLTRETKEVSTAFGVIEVKLGFWNGHRVQTAPEYESCRLAAERTGGTLAEVYRAAQQAAVP